MTLHNANVSGFPQLRIVIGNKLDRKSIKRFYKSLHYSFSYMGLDTVFLIKDLSKNIDKDAKKEGGNDDDIIASVVISKLSPENPQYLLHALIIAPSYRKQGLAKVLLHQVSHFMDDIKKQVCVQHRNNASISLVAFADKNLQVFYQKQGYIESTYEELLPSLSLRYRSYLKKQPNLNIFKFQA